MKQHIGKKYNWCENNNLILNPSKTKEMIIDYRKKKEPITPIFINNECIEIVDSFKFLGTTISSDLKWHSNTKLILKKAHQRLYFLRQLKKFNLNKEIMVNFYRAIIESILTFSTIIWFNSLSQAEKRKLNSIVNSCSRIIGVALPSLDKLYKDRLRTRCNKIILDRLHPANNIFELLPSGRRYRCMKTKTNRFINSMFPSAIRLLNEHVNE